MRRALAVVAAALSMGAASVDAQVLDPGELVQAIDSAAEAHISSPIIPGVSVAVWHNGQRVVQRGYGLVDIEWSVPTPRGGRAIYEIGSVTKQFTAAAVMLLAEEGRIDLEADFTDYMEFDTKGRTVPVRRLLDHTSGIKGYTEMEVFGDLMIQDLPRDTLVRLVEAEEFEFEPGEALIYNNSAYYFAGLIIEAVSGMSYEDFIQERLFDALGMENSYYCSEALVRENRAHGYDAVNPEMVIRARYLDHTWPYAAGSLCSTVEDLVIWNRALHGGEVLGAGAYTQMVSPFPLEDGTPTRYAMGLSIDDGDGRAIIQHGGGINGFLSDARYYPDEDLIVVVLQNATGPTGPAALGNVITDLVLGAQPEPSNEAFEGEASEIVGRYSGAARGQELSIEVRVDGGGVVFELDGNEEALRPTYRGGMLWTEGNMEIRFVPSPAGGMELRIDQRTAHYVLRRSDG